MLLNLLGNIICFIPYGFVIPVLSVRCSSFGKILLLSFLASLLVESIQLVSKLGSFDVDDIMLNTLGAVSYTHLEKGNDYIQRQNESEEDRSYKYYSKGGWTHV